MLARGKGETVLVVEDNDGMRRIVVRQLRSPGYEAIEAEDASSAFALLEHEAVDLIFTDVVISGGTTGFDIARITQSRWPAIKLVLTSGFPQANFADDPELLRTVRLLSKPYRKNDLAALIRDVLAA